MVAVYEPMNSPRNGLGKPRDEVSIAAERTRTSRVEMKVSFILCECSVRRLNVSGVVMFFHLAVDRLYTIGGRVLVDTLATCRSAGAPHVYGRKPILYAEACTTELSESAGGSIWRGMSECCQRGSVDVVIRRIQRQKQP